MNTIEIGEVIGDIPAALFGVNMQVWSVDKDLMIEGALAPIVTDSLHELPGALIRYPGGLMSNNFWWQRAVGERLPQSLDTFAISATVEFGIEEWLAFVEEIEGQALYVLNLRGWHETRTDVELPIEEVAASAGELASHLDGRVHLYQLGNELDRSEYEWPHDKYVARCRAVMDAILAVDPAARFIAFLRDFHWQYKTREGESRFQDLIRDVLNGLPEVNDFSLQFYYDDPGMEDVPSKNLTHRFGMFVRALDVAKELRQSPCLWITEHARGINLPAGNIKPRAWMTANLQGAISTGDCLIGLVHLAEGACLFGANATPWELFDVAHQYADLRPRPTYWALRVLHAMAGKKLLATTVASDNASEYPGGYDIRAQAYSDGSTIGLCAVNRANTAQRVIVAGVVGEQRHCYIAGVVGADSDDPDAVHIVELQPLPIDLGSEIVLPPLSVSSIEWVAQATEPELFGGEVEAVGGQLHVLADGVTVSDHMTYRKARQSAETAIRSGANEVVIRTDDERLRRA